MKYYLLLSMESIYLNDMNWEVYNHIVLSGRNGCTWLWLLGWISTYPGKICIIMCDANVIVFLWMLIV